jgi:hypothetical protein
MNSNTEEMNGDDVLQQTEFCYVNPEYRDPSEYLDASEFVCFCRVCLHGALDHEEITRSLLEGSGVDFASSRANVPPSVHKERLHDPIGR